MVLVRVSVSTQPYLPMPDWSQRSSEPEMIDSRIDRDLLYQNLHELDIANRLFGGHAASLCGIKELVKDRTKIYHVADLGCGSGDSLKHMADWARNNHYKLLLTGIDRSEPVIDYMKGHCTGYPEIKGVVSDYRKYMQDHPVDIVHCSLFCHHLSDNEILGLLNLFNLMVTTGFIINDLERSPAAYYSVKMLTNMIRSTSLSKHDGPVSVLRGFKVEELEALLKKGSSFKCTIQRRRAFRLLVVGHAAGRN